MSKRHQNGTVSVRRRTRGDVYIYRWHEQGAERSCLLGTVKQLKSKAGAWKEVDSRGLQQRANSPLVTGGTPRTFGELAELYKANELKKRSYSTQVCNELYLDNHIVPHWGECTLFDSEKCTPGPVFEDWFETVGKTPGTHQKAKNVMSAVFTYGLRMLYLASHPFRDGKVRVSGGVTKEKETLDAAELQALFGELGLMYRVLLMLDVPNGLRVGELLATKWSCVSWERKEINIIKSIWHQHEGPPKTEGSKTRLPMDDEMLSDLQLWRQESMYAGDDDYIFASPRMLGTQPFWPEGLMKSHIRPAATRAGITKHISWSVFRTTFSNLLMNNEEDIKTVQSMMRHSSPRVTLDAYVKAVTSKKRAAQNKVVAMIRPNHLESQYSAGQD